MIPSLFALGCAPSGEVVVVLDSTMRAEPVEVVAVPGLALPAAEAVGNSRSGGGESPHAERLRALTDSASVLASRFTHLRDSLNGEVAALERMDRRSRPYAVKYAEIRRRTLVAEHVRALRDSVRSQASALRVAAGIHAPGSDPAAGGPGAPREPVNDSSSIVRYPVQDSTVTLSLRPGRWSIGVARPGATAASWEVVSVIRGSSDTLRLKARVHAPGGGP